jgi:hypothetical protein
MFIRSDDGTIYNLDNYLSIEMDETSDKTKCLIVLKGTKESSRVLISDLEEIDALKLMNRIYDAIASGKYAYDVDPEAAENQ